MGNSLSAKEQEWVEKLQKLKQEHLLEPIKEDPAAVKRLLSQIISIDGNYPGGVANYIERAKKLLKESKEGVNPYEGCTPEVPEGEKLQIGTDEFKGYEALGMEEVANACFVLVAGGLGERLGYPGIKVALPSETSTMTSYAELYCKYILAYQAFARDRTGKSDLMLPLAIMTSDDTHEKTEKLFSSNDNFGLHQKQLTIMKQEKVPALMDNEARFAPSDSDKGQIQTKPHGHGDVHTLLNQHGLPQRWASEGRKWVVFFQDTNPLIFRSLPAVIGVSAKKRFVMNSVVVSRKPGEAVGGICKLNRPDGSSLTINVEYNQLDPLLKTTGDKQGDVPDPQSGNSRFPGNINVLLFDLARYSPVLSESKGTIPEFVNPKYKDDTKTTFKSPTRLECMMQEFARLFDSNIDRVGVTELERWLCFSAVKNNIVDAAEKSKKGLPSECAFSGEADVYSTATRMLTLAAQEAGQKVNVASGIDTTFANVSVKLGPRIVAMPSWALTFEDMKKRFSSPGAQLSISQDSTLVLDGDVQLEGLTLDGAAMLHADTGAKLIVRDLNVENKGWIMEPLGDEADENLKIRGYKIAKLSTAEHHNKAGTLIVP